MKNNYIVYMHTLRVDGRKYIGITCQKPTERWKNGFGYRKNSYFFNAIKKYGWDNFKHDIVFSGLSKEQACNKEVALIKLFRTAEHSYGFNLTLGGEHFESTEETKYKLSVINTKYRISKEDLIYQYITLDKTVYECANYFGCSESTISDLLHRYNIKKESKVKIDLEILYDLYVVQKKSQAYCAKYFGCSQAFICITLKNFNIAREIKPEITNELLYTKYIVEDKTQAECAVYFQCCRDTIGKYLKKFNISKS